MKQIDEPSRSDFHKLTAWRRHAIEETIVCLVSGANGPDVGVLPSHFSEVWRECRSSHPRRATISE
jgi:hypothetical protein